MVVAIVTQDDNTKWLLELHKLTPSIFGRVTQDDNTKGGLLVTQDDNTKGGC